MAFINRRNFLKSSTATSFIAGSGLLSALSAQSANAATTSGYKALVCVFFYGGMDSIDTVLPYDVESYDALTGIRGDLMDTYDVGSGNSSRDRANMLELDANNISSFGGRQFALPPEMSGLSDMFSAGDAAIVGNVGPLIEPTTRDTMSDYSAQIPERLYSHNDQQSTWMSLGVEGTQTGWGGKFSDAAILSSGANNPAFSAITTSSPEVFLAGDVTLPFTASSGGGQAIDVLRRTWKLGYGAEEDRAREVLKAHIAAQDAEYTNLFERDIARRSGRAIENNDTYSDALATALGITTEFPASNLGGQMKTVAEAISVRTALGVNRQVFFVSMGGFDTHDRQATELPELQSDMSQSFAAFKAAMVAEGIWDDVTVFTSSEFGRTAISNGDGTDHGWGGHHFVMGGSVQGKNIYGSLPVNDLSDQAYTERAGRMIPSVSVDQYAATLGSWFGLSDAELNAALPNLDNFAQKDLGFFNAIS